MIGSFFSSLDAVASLMNWLHLVIVNLLQIISWQLAYPSTATMFTNLTEMELTYAECGDIFVCVLFCLSIFCFFCNFFSRNYFSIMLLCNEFWKSFVCVTKEF